MRKLCTLLIGAAVLVSGSYAHAADKADAAPAVKSSNDADELTRAGIEAGQRKDWKKAHELLLRAWELKRAYDIAGNLARVEQALGLWAEATEHLYFAQRHMPAFAVDKLRKLGVEQFAEAEKQVLTLTVNCNVENAHVLVGGRDYGLTPLTAPVFLAPGTVEIEVRRDGYVTDKRAIVAAAGKKQELTIALKAEPSATQPRGGLDARLIAGATTGVGAFIGFGVGLGMTFVADAEAATVATKQSAVDAQGGCFAAVNRPDCVALGDAADARDVALDISDAGFVIGGVLAASSVGLLVWWALDDSANDDVVRVVPLVSGEHAGLILRGAW